MRIFMLMSFLLFSLTQCTLSFQNVHTEGVATDVVDSDPKTDAKVDTTLTIPVKPGL